MSLISALQSASSALQVFSGALGNEEINVTNSSTPGFAALRTSIQPLGFSGGDVIHLTSTGSLRQDAVVQAAASQAASSQTTASQLAPVNQLFDITGSSGLLASLRQFDAAFSSLSSSPNDLPLRAAALAAAGSVASSFNQVAGGLDTQVRAVDGQIGDTVTQINQLADQIRQSNVRARSDGNPQIGPDTALRSALDQLSSLVDINVTRNSDGTVSVLAGGQQPLVLGDQAFTLSANPQAAPGSQITSSGGGGSPVEYSGQLGALLGVRNGTLARLLGSSGSAGTLNTLAEGFAIRVNGLLTSGVDRNGAAGVPIFQWTAPPASNVARTLAVDPNVTGDQLALASAGPPAQSNAIANQLAALTNSSAAADQINGLSAQAFFASIATGVGQQLSDAKNTSVRDQTSLTSARTGRSQQSGVSLDQEAVAITALQQAYEANAKVVTVVNQLQNVEVNLIK